MGAAVIVERGAVIGDFASQAAITKELIEIISGAEAL
jgi:hypothetical protein